MYIFKSWTLHYLSKLHNSYFKKTEVKDLHVTKLLIHRSGCFLLPVFIVENTLVVANLSNTALYNYCIIILILIIFI